MSHARSKHCLEHGNEQSGSKGFAHVRMSPGGVVETIEYAVSNRDTRHNNFGIRMAKTIRGRKSLSCDSVRLLIEVSES